MPAIEIEFKSTNATAPISDLKKLQNSLSSTVAGTAALARSLGTGFKSAQEFAKAVGLTTQESTRAVARIKQLDSVNANAATKFKVLQKELGLSREQFVNLQRQLDSFNKKMADAAKYGSSELGIAKLANSFKMGYSEAQRFAEAVGLGANTITAATSRIKQLEAVNADSATQFKVLQRELGLTEDEFKKLKGAIDQYEKEAADAARASELQAKGLNIIQNAAGTIGGKIKAFGQQSAAAYGQFAGSLKQFEVIASANAANTQEDLDAVRAEAARLGQTTAKSAGEIAATTIGLARMGLTAKTISSILPGVTNGAIATGESMETLGQYLGSAATQFQIAGDDVETLSQMADILVKGANTAATDVNGLGQALGYVGGVAKAADQEFADVVASLGLMANAGVTNTRAGNQLANVITTLQTTGNELLKTNGQVTESTSKQGKALAKFGVEVVNADGSLRSVAEILPEMAESFQNLTPDKQAGLVEELFGKQAGKAIQPVLLQASDSMKEFTASINEAAGASESAGTKMNAGLGGSAALLSSAMEGLQIAFYENIAPIQEQFNRFAANVISGFLALPAPMKQFLLVATGIAGILATATAATIGFVTASKALELQQNAAAVAMVAKNAAAKIGITTDGIAAVTKGTLTAASTALNAATLTEAALIVKANLARLAENAALVASNALKSAGAIVTGGLATAQQVFAFATGKATVAQVGLNTALGVTLGVAAAAAASVALVVDTFNKVTGAGNETRKANEDLKESLSEIAQENPEALEETTEKLSERQQQIIDLEQSIKGLSGVEKEQAEAQLAALKNYDAVAESIGGVQKALDAVRNLIPGLTTAAEAAANRQAVAFDEMLQTVDGVLDDVYANVAMVRDEAGEIQVKVAAETSEEEIEAQLEALNKVKTAIESQKPATESAIVAQEEYLESIAKAEGILQAGLNERRGIPPATDEATEATEGLVGATEEVAEAGEDVNDSIDKRIDKLKEAQDIEKESAKRDFEDSNVASDRDFEKKKLADEREFQQQKLADERAFQSEKEAREKALQAQIDAAQKQSEAEVAALEQQLNQEIQAEEAAFNAEQEALKTQAEQERQAYQKAFDDSQAQVERALQDELQAKEKAFNEEQESEKRAFEDEIGNKRRALEAEFGGRKSEAEQRIARELQLEQAKDAAERARLEEQFKAEDEKAKRKAELEAKYLDPILAEEEAAKAALEEEEKAFEEQQREAQRAFEEEMRLKELENEALLEARKLAFEEQLAAVKAEQEALLEERQFAFEEQLAAKKLEVESQIEAKKLETEGKIEAMKAAKDAELQAMQQAFDDEQRAKEQAFADEQTAKKQAFEDEQREKQRAHEDEMRELEASHKEKLAELEKEAAAESAESLEEGGEAAGNALTDAASNAANTLEDINFNIPDEISVTGDDAPGRRHGGLVEAGKPYTVGEQGRELFIPKVAGRIIPHGSTERMLKQINEASTLQKAPILPQLTSTIMKTMNQSPNDFRAAINRLEKAIAKQPAPVVHQRNTFTNQFSRGDERAILEQARAASRRDTVSAIQRALRG